jgi:adenylyltransferase/sulfurtransferase
MHLNDIMRIHIPTSLRQYADKKDAVEVAGHTAGEGLANLTAQYPDLRRQLYTDDGKLRAFVNFYLNDEDIRSLQQENTPVKEGDSLSIVPSIAGGIELTIAE